MVSSRLFRFVVFEAMFKPLARYVWFGVVRRLPVQKIISDVSSDSQSLVVVAGLLEHWVAPPLSSDASCNGTQRSTEWYAAQNKTNQVCSSSSRFSLFFTQESTPLHFLKVASGRTHHQTGRVLCSLDSIAGHSVTTPAREAVAQAHWGALCSMGVEPP